MSKESELSGLHVRPNLEAGIHLAGSFLPPGGLLAGTIRDDNGPGLAALVILPKGLWVRWEGGEITPLPAAVGRLWLERLCESHRLTSEEGAALAGVGEDRFGEWMGDDSAITPRAVRKLLVALHLMKDG